MELKRGVILRYSVEIATLLRCVLSVDVKQSLKNAGFICTALQDMHSLSA